MFSDVERLKNILSELADTISQPNTLPVTTKEFVEVSVWLVQSFLKGQYDISKRS